MPVSQSVQKRYLLLGSSSCLLFGLSSCGSKIIEPNLQELEELEEVIARQGGLRS